MQESDLAKEAQAQAVEDQAAPTKFPGPYEMQESCGRGDVMLRNGDDIFRIATFYKGNRVGKTGKKIHLDPLTLASDYVNFMNYQFCLAMQDRFNRKKTQDAGEAKDQDTTGSGVGRVEHSTQSSEGDSQELAESNEVKD